MADDEMEEASPAEAAAAAQAAGGRFRNTFVFNVNAQSDTRIPEHAGARGHARDTPRTQVLMPPPTGSTWSWTPLVIGADGAEAGPNGIMTVVSETLDGYCPVRGHCSVHVKRNMQQNKHKVLEGEPSEKEKIANTLCSMMEQVKCHSMTIALAELGKRMIADHLEVIGQGAAKDWYVKHHQVTKWTLIELNANTEAGGGVPCHANGIERSNLQQKVDGEWKRISLTTLVQTQFDEVGQTSMDDSTFGDKMPKGYNQVIGKGDARYTIDKTVWTTAFFDMVKSELRHSAGLHRLIWKARKEFGGYPADSLIVCARKMRSWLFTGAEFADYYAQAVRDKDKVARVRSALDGPTTNSDGTKAPSFIKQFKSLISNPTDGYVKEQGLAFTDVIEWQNCFHVLQPISCETYVRDLVTRLQNSGLVLNEDAVNKLYRGEDGENGEDGVCFYKCSCGRYLHYLWCLHIMMLAIHVGLVKEPYCPPTMDSTKIAATKNTVMKRGRPAKSTPGGALSKKHG